MAKFIITGGNRLKGTITVNGSKNATLPILAASILAAGECIIHEVPHLQDITTMSNVLEGLGARVKREGTTLTINTRDIYSWEVGDSLMRRMRASNLVLGPLLGRFKQVKISYPGGCNIGSRPMDLHLKGLRALGADINEKYGYINVKAENLKGTEIHLDVPSVGATENIMMTAVMTKGVTIIRSAAREPEIVDLQNFLNCLGAKIRGAGTSLIKVEGVTSLHKAEHTVIPDRIEAGTYLIGTAITGGDVTVTNVIPEHLESLLAKLKEIGVKVEVKDEAINISSTGCFKATNIKTMPYPGFHTDLQPQMMALLTLAQGTSVITETIFENRYQHVSELRRLGAEITVEGQTAIIRGVKRLSGAPVEATDLRAGAALLLAALVAENNTVIKGVEHIDRGYEQIEDKYNALGANIKRV
ncbi:UDP-N-acetylglucosamine 1-carboxyvinyltransferase [Peptococcaceae bacterium SCADC1_2_3]|jgi:UDP-N-acetylglucosamine 1-carboxyvinyltransferase|nr:UDP-N-acetylglucosamine 1-carboxyvinyltransferase [Peptococcaceae bacterium SCADC1_2_3]KFI37136.1 UDP-N-acetylglucosamine 1-carboxyvinyltransferase [Peptococcaceae bacterium SCADC1_2_3]HBQ28825.1 UDP-N-acetylglucosamine 1-carboxyvinyltransferase [Desulfotomaculum sp.]HCJ78925.1 UDP-N-acetylglucosamine 1-carboxyvinyltransferase [Desulfotomaculum sp.]